MNDAILVLNAGSSSIKFSVFVTKGRGVELKLKGQIEGLFTSPRFIARSATGEVLREQSWNEGEQLGHEGAIEHLRGFLQEQRDELKLVGMGHRVGHGGTKYLEPVRVSPEVLAELEKLVPLVPLHQPHNLAPIRLAMQLLPDVPQVACFDTGFHHTNPPLARMLALPESLTSAGVKRYGFHGLSFEYIASILPKRAPEAAKGKTIVLHLGNGSSLCALDACKSIATTMGFSSLDGVPMGTRCGALDPGVILYLLEHENMDVRAIEKLLYTQSGLLGVSGISSDVRELLASKEPRAELALDLFIYRIGRELGSLTAALGGLDALVFTAGIGENAVAIRERICRDAAWLGVKLDAAANARGGPCITTARSKVAAWVLPTNEELMIARHTLRLLSVSRKQKDRPLAVAA